MEKEQLEEIMNPDGSLKQGVKIIEADSGLLVAEGEKPAKKGPNFSPGDPLFLDDSYSGDMCELRNIFLLNKRHDLAKALSEVDKRRILLLREHLLQLAATHKNLKDLCLEIVMIICRLMQGDIETDLAMPNDDLDVGLTEDSDEEENCENCEK